MCFGNASIIWPEFCNIGEGHPQTFTKTLFCLEKYYNFMAKDCNFRRVLIKGNCKKGPGQRPGKPEKQTNIADKKTVC